MSNIKVGMKFEQIKKIEEYGFDFVGYEFEVVEATEKVIKFKSSLGYGAIETVKFEEYFREIKPVQVTENGIKIIRSNNVTVVILPDGSKGVSKCLDGDIYDSEKGYEIALLKAEIKSKTKRLKELSK